MKKVLLFIVLTFSIVVAKCQKKEVSFQESLHNLVEQVVFDNNEKENVMIQFFVINDKEYLKLIPTSYYSIENLKGYIVLDRIVVFYYGIEDSIAKRFLHPLETDFSNISASSFDESGSVDFRTKDIYYFKILNGKKFQRINPDKFLRNEINNVLIGNGYFLLPPAPPFEGGKGDMIRLNSSNELTTLPEFPKGDGKLLSHLRNDNILAQKIKKIGKGKPILLRFEILETGRVKQLSAIEFSLESNRIEDLHVDDFPNFIPGTIDSLNVKSYYFCYVKL